jgi:hypothetical protein
MPLMTLTETAALDWEGLLNRWGMPTVILGLIAWAVYRLTRWAAPRADKVIDSHVQLVATLESKLTATEEHTKRTVEKLVEIEGTVEDIDRKVTELGRK